MGRDEGYPGMDLDHRMAVYDMGHYTQPGMNPFAPIPGHLYGDNSYLQLEEDGDHHYAKKVQHLMPTQTLIPLTHHFTENNPTFVNAKQYEAIMRRRMKKMKQQKALGISHMRIKKKYKYETRSLHARKRQRAKDGKFLSVPENNDARTVSTVLKVQEDEPEEERTPCCADEPEEELPRRNEIAEKEGKVKLEIDNMDNMSMNSEELLGDFRAGPRRSTRRDHLDHSAFEDGPSLRHHDSLFDSKR